MRVKACGLSDVGLTRAHNEDYFEIDPHHRLYVVADGMGGHSHGEVAAQLAVNAIRDFIAQDAPTATPPGRSAWTRASSAPLEPAQDGGADRPRPRPARDQQGRLALRHGDDRRRPPALRLARAAVAHVGDSRAYRLRDGRLEQLTQDHTWVNEQVVAGFLSKEQARSHPLKNVVTRALGGESDVVVDVRELEVQPGDLYLLCSDGLTGMLSDADIRERLASGRSLHEICRTLINDSNARGGIDNVTVVLLAIEGEEAGTEDEECEATKSGSKA